MNDPRRPFRETAVVFDLDGTLVDSEPNYFQATLGTLGRYGVTGFTWEDNESYVGISTAETIGLWKRRFGITAPAGELLDDLNSRYLDIARTQTRVFPQMRLFVERLHAAGVPMIVASGSSPEAIEAILTGTRLIEQLPRYVSADEVARGKPEPDVFLEAARRLGVVPARCVVLEDAAPGARAAHAAGMRCIAVPYVAAQSDDPAFTAADLLFKGGQEEFTARAACEWLERSAPSS
ncbi:HAD family phosphatase [Streptomyces sp. VRA16 Mangrove soil]|uniref:HAD family hydrolase n=1 Tax=Streptomyces sp. VRA16 Mangrove soil TaxID=2817434 RepID=UPI001A9EC5BF|nr:HAD family phosphatase [Streptomyces sp. VRA16 Mangrove soil]MBO1332222.1 HAD family phosphatase [Streptomyces sp. VRA16 Mangrove soil]